MKPENVRQCPVLHRKNTGQRFSNPDVQKLQFLQRKTRGQLILLVTETHCWKFSAQVAELTTTWGKFMRNPSGQATSHDISKCHRNVSSTQATANSLEDQHLHRLSFDLLDISPDVVVAFNVQPRVILGEHCQQNEKPLSKGTASTNK